MSKAKAKIGETACPAQAPLHASPATGSRTHLGGREIELDFLRGIAILMVLDYHAPVHWLSYPLRQLGFPNFGWAGVDVFFVLSGFLVGGLLVKEWRTRGSIDQTRFLVRRGFKIWPQYYLFLLVLLVTGHRSFQNLLGNLANLQNYFGGVPHTWSLAVEEHAYVLLAFGLAWAAKAKMRVRTLAVTLAATSLVIAVCRLILAHAGFEVTMSTHTRIDGILYGVVLAIVFHYRPSLFQALQRRRWLWSSLLGISLLYLRFQPQTAWGSSLGWDAGNLLGIALLMLLQRSGRTLRRPWPYRLVAWVGVYSYGIYLWHVSVIAPSLAIASRSPSILAPGLRAVLPIVAGIALGAGLTKAIEMPALQLRDRWFPRGVASPVEASAEIERVGRSAANLATTAPTPQVAGV